MQKKILSQVKDKFWKVFKLSGEKSEVEERKSESFYYASGFQLTWRAFKRHKLAIMGISVLVILYSLAMFSGFFSPYGVRTRIPGYRNTPPTRIHFFSEKSGFRRPYVYALDHKLNPETFLDEYTEDRSKEYTIHFFVKGEPYKLLGLFPTNIHFFGSEVPIFLFGTASLSRDLFSRTLYGGRVSLSIGLAGVFVSFLLGIFFGGISGYSGGVVDEIVQRTVDLLICIPTLPLWMVLSAAVPRNWSVTKTYFAITLVLAVVGWCGLARVVRGKLLSLREEEFAVAAKISGNTEFRIIGRHLLPNFLSYLIVYLTLAVPTMILGETALSFLGVGMQAPAVSWGVLLKDCQNLTDIAFHLWKLIPGIFVVITVLMFNFVGDGLRDAADPYKTSAKS